MKKKHESISRELLFYCFVDFGKAISDAPKCWLLPSAVVSRTLATAHQAWLTTPGKGGLPRNDHDMRRLLPHYLDAARDPSFAAGWLDAYREAWSLIAAS